MASKNTANIPTLGIGTYRLHGDAAEQVVYDAISIGYRHIDTAVVYRNEAAIGHAIKRLIADNIVNRSDLFITSKISPKQMGYERTKCAILESLSNLSVDYIDLMLLHWPGTQGKKAQSPINPINRIESMKALTEAFHAGKIRALGVSNFMKKHFDGLEQFPILVNQVEFHPLQATTTIYDLKSYCSHHGIAMAAYSSLGEGALLDVSLYPELDEVANRRQCTVAQVLLAWAMKLGWIVIPKASSKSRIEENFHSLQVVDRLTDEDMCTIQSMLERCGPRKFCWDPSIIS